jgi:3-deoxy-D-manno-octulosonic-acid transferase
MQRVLQFVDLALMQGNKDAQRIIQLGIRADKVKVTGNIKFDQGFEETENQLTQEFRERFAISENAPLIVAASTHAPEEVWILEAFAEVREKSEGKLLPRLLIAPRHPERFAEVAELIKNAGFKWSRRSAKPSDKDKIAEIILLDSIGELRTVFPLAEIVFVGGSLIPHGGQNILEPAIARKAIATGFYTTNFAEIVREFLAQDALVQLPKLDEREISKQLTEVFSELLQNAERRQKLGRNAFMIMQKSCGATSETIKQLKPFLQVQNKL